MIGQGKNEPLYRHYLLDFRAGPGVRFDRLPHRTPLSVRRIASPTEKRPDCAEHEQDEDGDDGELHDPDSDAAQQPKHGYE